MIKKIRNMKYLFFIFKKTFKNLYIFAIYHRGNT